ncbi:hypothetical protein EC973_005894 [Apophysomyces ossiformis]|uniref:WH2 domain-containing protein n=1 Tax=Apophysomyces ossiformis TaxID=679940 RepID=A0A8H7EL46_9FUNG|nr:hypothetical protein EC973_005894 [Apophysomyces ossiformis]
MARPPARGAPRPPPTGGLGEASVANQPALGGGPQLGGLFVNGMPTLRKTRGAAVDTGRGTTSVPSPPAAALPRPPVSSKPPTAQTLPRSFKAPPPIPGRNLINTSLSSASTPPPPPPPPPPTSAGISSQPAMGIPPSIKSSLATPPPGRTRSNSSPQRPIPPPPPRNVPTPPGSPSYPSITTKGPPMRSVPLPGANTASSLAVPPPLPPGRTRSVSTSDSAQAVPSVNNISGSFASPPPPPPPPAPPSTQRPSQGLATPPRSPLPPPPPPPPSRLSPSVNSNVPRAPVPPPQNSHSPLSQQIPLTEGGGRFRFRTLSELPAPRSYNNRFRHVYPSGEERGSNKSVREIVNAI